MTPKRRDRKRNDYVDRRLSRLPLLCHVMHLIHPMQRIASPDFPRHPSCPGYLDGARADSSPDQHLFPHDFIPSTRRNQPSGIISCFCPGAYPKLGAVLIISSWPMPRPLLSVRPQHQTVCLPNQPPHNGNRKASSDTDGRQDNRKKLTADRNHIQSISHTI